MLHNSVPLSSGTRGCEGANAPLPKILSPPQLRKSRKNGPTFCEIMKKMAFSCSGQIRWVFEGLPPLKWSKPLWWIFWRSCPLKNVFPPIPPKKFMLTPPLTSFLKCSHRPTMLSLNNVTHNALLGIMPSLNDDPHNTRLNCFRWMTTSYDGVCFCTNRKPQ